MSKQKLLLQASKVSTPSAVRQCELLDLPRSSIYYQPVAASNEDLHLMKLLDKQYLQRIGRYAWWRGIGGGLGEVWITDGRHIGFRCLSHSFR